MKGVGLLDQKISTLHIGYQQQRLWMNVFFWCLDLYDLYDKSTYGTHRYKEEKRKNEDSNNNDSRSKRSKTDKKSEEEEYVEDHERVNLGKTKSKNRRRKRCEVCAEKKTYMNKKKVVNKTTCYLVLQWLQ